MAKLSIISTEDAFSWRSIAVSEEALGRHTVARNIHNLTDDPEYELLFLTGALRELHEFIGWGNMRYPKNRVEQIGFLAGRHYETASGKRYCVVSRILPVHEASGSSTYIEFSADMMHSALTRLESHNEGSADPEELIGWFHTHPNSLETFMSGTDMRTQHRVFNSDHNYSVVLNPHTRSWKAFRGYDARDSFSRWLDIDDISEIAASAKAPKNKPEMPRKTAKKNTGGRKARARNARKAMAIYKPHKKEA